jgi:hypothetical protein
LRSSLTCQAFQAVMPYQRRRLCCAFGVGCYARSDDNGGGLEIVTQNRDPPQSLVALRPCQTLTHPPDQVGYQIAANQRGDAWVRTVMTGFSVDLFKESLVAQAAFAGELREGQPQWVL